MIRIKYIFWFVLLWNNLNFYGQEFLSGKVIGVSDGDTFTMIDQNNDQYKIRLAEIDCPEKSQPFGQVAKKCLSVLIFGKNVMVEYNVKDRYDRIIGKVFVGQLYVSEEMIRAGYAWHYKKYSSSVNLARLEYQVRKEKKGLWAVPGPIAPWEWRKL